MKWIANIRGDGETGDVYCEPCVRRLDTASPPLGVVMPLRELPRGRKCVICSLTPEDYEATGEVSC